MRHINIPVFIPHLGCPNNCVFCDQRKISGCISFDESGVRKEIETALSTVLPEDDVEIAFFGGSFTGIDRDLMIRLLEISDEFIRERKVSRVRCSTRPDYIDAEILAILREHHVKTVELGIQSLSDSVLSASKRGHTAEASLKACKRVKEAGFELIGQMMIGLPGSTPENEIATARAICDFCADGARVYPTVVFADTELADMALSGKYVPLSIDDAIERTASVLDVFDRAGVPVIRVGLCSGENLSSPESVVGGANHPALGELAMGELMYRRICEEADRVIETCEVSGRTMTVFVPHGATSRAIGQKKRNILRLNEKYCKKHAINRIKILENSSIIGYNIIIDFS
ncbi:MAG: radical SAM protein [Clostridia bacterium]|nr:radical SAM protein [Clostridia bacterium]